MATPTNKNWRAGNAGARLAAAPDEVSRRALLKAGLAGVALAPFANLLGLTDAFAQASTDQELRIAVEDFVDEEMDATRTSTELDEVLCAMFDPPFQIDDSGKVAPGIVKAWEISADGASWTLHLRDDVVFHDGSKMTATDVAYSYWRSCQDFSFEHDTWVDMLGKEPKIDITDDTTLVVHTNGSQPLFAGLSTEYGASVWIVPKAYIDKVGLDGFRDHPIATGPYQFVEHVAGDHFTMQAVGYKHWRSSPQFAKVTVALVPEEATRVSLLRTNALDETVLSRESAMDLQKDGFTIWQGVSQRTYLVVIGAYNEKAKSSPLSNLKFRQALSYAINRQEIVDSLFADVASVPTAPTDTGLDMPDMSDALRKKWGEWAKENYVYDPDKAKALLAESGVGNASFDFVVAPDSGAPFHQDLSQAVVGYWTAVGINAVLSNINSGLWKAQRNTHKSDALIGKIGILTGSLDKVSAVENLGPFTSESGALDTLWGSDTQAEYDTTWKEAMATLDPSTQEKDLGRMIRL